MVAVVLMIFNRAEPVKKVADAIYRFSPSKLLVIADGPREHQPSDVQKCLDARAVVESFDWDCDVLKNYSDVNLGCAKRVASGLDWVFENVDEAMILEDDCVPHPSFFRFCSELLEYYRHDSRIMSVAGTNVQLGRSRTDYSYYFSRYNHYWGWSTWKRAWQHFDFAMKAWPEIRDTDLLAELLDDKRAAKYWSDIFQATYEGSIDSWAYRWVFSCWAQSGLSILPDINLISNVGFGEDATHTVNSSDTTAYANMPLRQVAFPLRHPPYMIRHAEADRFTQETFWHPSLTTRSIDKFKRIVSKI